MKKLKIVIPASVTQDALAEFENRAGFKTHGFTDIKAENEFARFLIAAHNACLTIPVELLESEHANQVLSNFASTVSEIDRLTSKLSALEAAHSEGNSARLVTERMDAQDEAARLLELIIKCRPFIKHVVVNEDHILLQEIDAAIENAEKQFTP